LAGAGSGKTRVITQRVAHLIRGGTRPENILAVTFTNKAAREMRERVQSLLGTSRAAEPLISTFHSFCVRLLRREIHQLGYRRDFSIYDTDDQKRLMKRILQESGPSGSSLTPRDVLSRISYAKNHNLSADVYGERFHRPEAEEIEQFYVLYEKRLRQANALDFDDLLLKAVTVLKKLPDRRAHYSTRYRYILVDEYQDTNRPQYELLRLLCASHRNLFVVGDEDQSIYKFRGADIGNILNFEKDFKGAHIIKLEQNYRSTQNILNAAGSVVNNNTSRKGKVLWTENHTGDVITCRRTASARAEAGWVGGEIENLLAGEPDTKIAILYRTNFLSRNFEDVLMEMGIPYAVVGSVAFFGRMEIKDLLAYLRVIYNPEDDVALLRILNTPPRGIGSSTAKSLTQRALERGIPLSKSLKELSESREFAGRAFRSLQRFQALLDKWSAGRDSLSLAQMLERILEATLYREMLEKRETVQDAADRWANIEELIRAATESEDRGETAFEFLDRASLASELDHLDSNARVALMTLHSAKGLEFDTVFLAGLEEGLFPHALSLDTPEDLEEERRLCYVGITRAMNKLYISWTPFRRTFGSDGSGPSLPSRFLGEIPPELIEGMDLDPEYFDDERDNVDSEETYPEKAAWKPGPKQAAADPVPGEHPKTMAELRAYLEKTQGSGKESGRPVLKSGMRVRHPKFGDGIILSRRRMGNDVRIDITFSRVGRKTLVERYAKLEPL